MLQPDNLRVGSGEWGIPIVIFPLQRQPPLPPMLFPYSPLPTLLTTTDIEMVNLCEF